MKFQEEKLSSQKNNLSLNPMKLSHQHIESQPLKPTFHNVCHSFFLGQNITWPLSRVLTLLENHRLDFDWIEKSSRWEISLKSFWLNELSEWKRIEENLTLKEFVKQNKKHWIKYNSNNWKLFFFSELWKLPFQSSPESSDLKQKL